MNLTSYIFCRPASESLTAPSNEHIDLHNGGLSAIASSEQPPLNDISTPGNNVATPPMQDGTKSPTGEDGTQDKEKKQKHAMDFLLKVRSHYAQTPTVYNEFLEIMKDFKSAV